MAEKIYLKHTRGVPSAFYSSTVHSAIPSEAIEISREQHQQLLTGNYRFEEGELIEHSSYHKWDEATQSWYKDTDAELQKIKQSRRNEVQALFETKLGDGLEFDGHLFDCDANSQSSIVNATQLAQTAAGLGQDFTAITWTTADNQLYEIKTLDQLNNLGLVIGNHVQSLYAVRNHHKATILNLTSSANVLSYDISTGWPP